jgi:hypothetical protein
MWSAFLPHETTEAPLQDKKCMVHDIKATGNGPHVLLGHCQLSYFQLSFEPFIGRLSVTDTVGGCFQLNGATTHTANVSMAFLSAMFCKRITSKCICQPRLSHLTTFDFHMWEAIKGSV